MKQVTIITAIILLFAATACNKQEPGQIKVDGGLVKGTIENGLTVFKGILQHRQSVISGGALLSR